MNQHPSGVWERAYPLQHHVTYVLGIQSQSEGFHSCQRLAARSIMCSIP